MNERFNNLPKEKQQAIINAGYREFSQNSYKNSPMSEIADAAGICKSLLFHYFRNKKELYTTPSDSPNRKASPQSKFLHSLQQKPHKK